MIGDQKTDMIFAKRCGVKAIFQKWKFIKLY